MTESTVPLVVRSVSQDVVETVGGILRDAGLPVRCTWIAAPEALRDALRRIGPEVLIEVAEDDHDLQPLVALRNELAPAVPIVLVVQSIDEAGIAQAMSAGARDAVSLQCPARLAAVIGRELRVFRLEQAMRSTIQSAQDRLADPTHRPSEAIIQILEGIVVDANPAWLELFGPLNDVVGQPVMDLFDEATRPALKGALAACLQGRWSAHTLKAGALRPDGTALAVEVSLAQCEHEGQPGVRLIVPAKSGDESRLVEKLEQVVQHDQTSGLLHRRELLEALRRRLAVPAQGGVRAIVLVKLDRFAAIERAIGATASEDVIGTFAHHLRETLHPNEIAGRFGGVRFLMLLERGNERDLQVWARQLIQDTSGRTERIRDKTISLTCTVAVATVPRESKSLDKLIDSVSDACAKASQRGGNQLLMCGSDDGATPYDESWIKQIKNALMQNRFRLATQPVASLRGGDPRMFDVLLRMIDTRGKEVLPGEFLPAAERNDLLKNIDRWVVGASLSFAAQRRPNCLFVRLSKDTVQDASFIAWLEGHVRSTRADPQRVCFQVTEATAVAYPQLKLLAEKLRQWGFRFALDSFGSGGTSIALLESMPLDYVKIDGALVQTLSRNKDLQHHVRALTEEAAKLAIQTIAERVEDANTMAVLWQLGVEYIQGYFVNAPEDVVLQGSAR